MLKSDHKKKQESLLRKGNRNTLFRDKAEPQTWSQASGTGCENSSSSPLLFSSERSGRGKIDKELLPKKEQHSTLGSKAEATTPLDTYKTRPFYKPVTTITCSCVRHRRSLKLSFSEHYKRSRDLEKLKILKKLFFFEKINRDRKN